MNIQLSNYDIENVLGKSIKILTYKELTKYNTIAKAFGKHKFIGLLYERIEGNGHWVLLINHRDSIEHFDSYGIFPDDELKFTDIIYRKKNNMYFPYLTYLLLNSKKKKEYNNYKFQKENNNISTCGRWLLFRAKTSLMNIDKFNELINKLRKERKTTNDKLIVKLTKDLLPY